MINTQLDWKKALAARGILDAALTAKWDFQEYNGAPGWCYPLYKADGTEWAGVKRWKALDSTYQPKYSWLYSEGVKEKPVGCDWYWLPGAVGAIKTLKHLNILPGEPDCLTFYQVGIRNSTTLLSGEGAIPENTLTVLNTLGVERVTVWLDNDNPGWDAGQKWRDWFADKTIGFEAKVTSSSAKDPNAEWVELKFNEQLFQTFVANAVPLTYFERVANSSQTEIHELPEAFYAAVVSALKAKPKSGRAAGWSKPVQCPFHGDDHASAGWHFDKHILRCFTCGKTYLAVETGQQLNIDYKTFFSHENGANGSSAHTAPKNGANGHTAPNSGNSDIEYGSDSAARYRQRLKGAICYRGNPVLIPMLALHRFGGFAKMIQPGRLIGLIAPSGGGKTTFLENWVDHWLRAGIDPLWWGPEWTPDDLMDRRVQRWGGVTFAQMMDFEYWKREEQQGIPVDKRKGMSLTPEQIAQAEKVVEYIESWKGRAIVYRPAQVTLEVMLPRLAAEIEKQRGAGRKPDVVIWDYAALLRTDERIIGNHIEQMVNRLAGFCRDNAVVGLVASQVNKDAIRGAHDGRILTAQDGNFLKDSLFSLFLTLTPEYEGEIGLEHWTGRSTLAVVKNSGGRSGSIEIMNDFQTLQIHPVQNGANHAV